MKFSVAAPVQACLIFLKSLGLAFICVCRSFFGVCAYIPASLWNRRTPSPPHLKKKKPKTIIVMSIFTVLTLQ